MEPSHMEKQWYGTGKSGNRGVPKNDTDSAQGIREKCVRP